MRTNAVKANDRRRGIIFHPTFGYPIPPPVAPTVAKRNARERSRVKTVNESYQALKARVPSAANAKRMAKVDIIKHTIEYIQELKNAINRVDDKGFSESNHFPKHQPSFDQETFTYEHCKAIPKMNVESYETESENYFPNFNENLNERWIVVNHQIQNNCWRQQEADMNVSFEKDEDLLQAIADWQNS